MIKRTLCFSNPAYLSLNNSQMVIKLPGAAYNKKVPPIFEEKTTQIVPIEDIGIVVLDNRQITITQGLIEKLLDNKLFLTSQR